MLSHHMILNNAHQLGLNMDYDKRRTVICTQVPLYHCFGMVLASLNTIAHGATCVLPSATFNAEASLKAIDKEKSVGYFILFFFSLYFTNIPLIRCHDDMRLDAQASLVRQPCSLTCAITQSSPLTTFPLSTEVFINQMATLQQSGQHFCSLVFFYLQGVMSGATCPIEIVNDCVKKLNTKNIVVSKKLLHTDLSVVVASSSTVNEAYMPTQR